MARYAARIGGAVTWVNADDAIDVGLVEQHPDGSAHVAWIGQRTWNEIAGDGRMLVTPGQQPDEVLEVWCGGQPERFDDEDAPLSSLETQIILKTLEDSGYRDLAARITPILDRCTKTDPPPPPAARRSAKPA